VAIVPASATARADRTGDAIQALLERKDYAGVVTACEAAASAGVPEARLRVNWIYALALTGRVEEALRRLDDAPAQPRDYALVNLRGVVLKQAGRFDEAIECFEQASRIKPSILSAWQNLGNTYGLQGRHAQAARAFKRAIRIAPTETEVLRMLGAAHINLGEFDDAVKVLRRLVSLKPAIRAGWSMLATALHRSGKADAARAVVEQARTQLPNSSVAYLIAADLDHRAGRTDLALESLREAQRRFPGDLDTGLRLAKLLDGRASREAAQVLEQVNARHPGLTEVLSLMLYTYGRARHDDEGAHLERAYALAIELQDRHPLSRLRNAREMRTIFARLLDPDRFARTGGLAELLPYWLGIDHISAVHHELGHVADLADRHAVLDAHRSWGQAFEARVRPLPPMAPAVHGQRKLRVGFMSSDLRNHPVSYFALPLLERFDRDAVEVYCYSFCTKQPDAVQQHIERQVTQFRLWPNINDEQAARGIRADDLDILFELGAMTQMNKLGVMAWRPARLGASWLGYPHSAGLSAIDYILMDPHTLPTEPGLLLEKPFMMPDSWVVLGRLGFVDSPIDERLPQERQGALTFGTANNPYKFTPACFDAWAAVLREVEQSRFLFLRPEAATETFRRNAARIFAERGVDPERLDFVGVRGTHLPHYNRIDIALDSLPHVGGTTTCESLWMGVPTVTLAGIGFCERLAHSNLVNAGVPELSAPDVAGYVRIAVDLAHDRAKRRHLRGQLRSMIRNHPLGQEQRFVDAFYAQAARVCA
jgi:predicted O-linked N-acetylglucosamine transferase (SPINDLY family)